MDVKSEHIRGSTLIIDLMRRFPDGRATELMGRLGWACAHCSALTHEPLALAAKRHGNPVPETIRCFRALQYGEVPSELIEAAMARTRRSPDPTAAWLRSARWAADKDVG